MRRQRLLAAAALLAFLFCLFPATAFAAEDETKTANYDGYIMKLRDGASVVPSAAGPEPVEYCDGVYLIDDPAEALPYLKCGAVEYVEPNYTLELLDDTPNDPEYGDQWTLNAINYQSLYASGKDGSGVTVAVIDSGLYAWTEDGTYHGQEDFQSAVISPASRNFLGQESASALYYRDQKGHGTFVASQIAAATGNGVGISGIADGVTLMILRCIAGNTSATYPTDATMDSNSGSAAIVASAIYYATDHGADVINLSLGTTSSNAGVTLADSIAYAADKGVIIVAAAGNFGSTATCYPAGNSNVIGVASVDSSLERSSFSQYNDSVDVAAPGGMVCGANLYADGTGAVTTASYTTDSGTSYAAPVVSALAAIAKQYNKALDGDDFMSLLAVTSTDKGDAGKDNSYGYGVVDAQKLLAALQAPYSIEYVLNGTTEAPASLPANAPSTYALSRTDTITLPVPVRDGYAFTGWYELATLAGEPVTTLPAGALAFAAYDGAGVYSIPALKYYAGWKSYDAAKLSALSVKGRLAQEGASADTYSVTLPKGSAASLAALTAADFSIQCADSTAVVSGLATSDGGATWTFRVSAGQAIKKTYTVTVTLSDLAVPAVNVGAQSGTALLPSMDGLTAAGPYTADVSAWFADASRYVVLANTGSGTAQITDSTLSYTPGSSDFEGQQVTLTVGAANADFASDNTVAVTVTIGRAASNATAVLSTAQLDVFKDSALSAVLTMYANTLKSISLGARVLAEGTDYTVSGAELDTTRTVTFSKEFVQGLTPGTVNITFGFSGGHDAVAALTVTDSAPRYDVKFFWNTPTPKHTTP